MSTVQNMAVLCLIVLFAVLEWRSHNRARIQPSADDTKLEAFMFLALLGVAQPLAFFLTGKLCASLLPQYHNALASLPWWAMVGILFLGDDMLQYWWHRASHSALLWPLHRAHHSAHYMSIRVTYRNNFFYYLLMPSLWASGVLIYLGFGWVYAAYIVVKIGIILGAHCAVPWDAALYRVPALRPLVWVLERTVSTPATHWAHHALTNADGVGHYTGNFGNMLFIWDQLFGTAKITRRYPAQVGLQDDLRFGKERWFVEMFYPLVQSKRERSALVSGGKPYGDEDAARDRAVSQA